MNGEPPCRLPPGPRAFAIGWIGVTHVCKHWRQVALDEPWLWTDVTPDMGRRWTWEFITRAGQMPLGIYGEREARLLPVLVASGHLSHTQALAICCDDRRLLRIVRSLITVAAPVLESLALGSTRALGETAIPILEDFLAVYAPRLRTAVFVGLWIPWSSPIIRNLTKLHVSIDCETFDGDHIQCPTPPSELFDALANMPYLEDLAVSYAIPPFQSRPAEPQRQRGSIVLRHLSHLKLQGPYLDVPVVLDVIQFSALTVLELEFYAGDSRTLRALCPPLGRYSDMPLGVEPNIRLYMFAIGSSGRYWIYSRHPAAEPLLGSGSGVADGRCARRASRRELGYPGDFA
ncbi:hypothetical protein HETIRDRAFT_317186 [Heterobasidion irregulare TC 32-1]|uniref:Uncharacterized protein n=1 Tax=Heterobasidion irregulare (strain TC 32-1) TaxID=747525 RepID=W4K8J5_HETIT|nr:uncharacterized protein HETIRDRAFT_317186 [Heterobasidion irregulare TC 32-1]ETW81376.1 hypothetical protein HETIRDRAFT_317186 [Heterobasidion irregulare TC 32-1]